MWEENNPPVSLEIAKQIKKEGFNKPTIYFYLDKDLAYCTRGLNKVKENERKMNHNRFDEFVYSAPFEKDYLTWRKQQGKKLGKKIVDSLETVYKTSPASSKEIDAYNYGVKDSIKKVNEIIS